jgi:hypothetical protein
MCVHACRHNAKDATTCLCGKTGGVGAFRFRKRRREERRGERGRDETHVVLRVCVCVYVRKARRFLKLWKAYEATRNRKGDKRRKWGATTDASASRRRRPFARRPIRFDLSLFFACCFYAPDQHKNVCGKSLLWPDAYKGPSREQNNRQLFPPPRTGTTSAPSTSPTRAPSSLSRPHAPSRTAPTRCTWSMDARTTPPLALAGASRRRWAATAAEDEEN